jgi:hypothetical protein
MIIKIKDTNPKLPPLIKINGTIFKVKK